MTVKEKSNMRSMERVVVRVKAVEVEAATSVQVSIIESSMLLEIEWPHREGFLIDVMHMVREVRI